MLNAVFAALLLNAHTIHTASWQIVLRVHGNTVLVHFIVQMRAGAAAGGTQLADLIAFGDRLPSGDEPLGQMGV